MLGCFVCDKALTPPAVLLASIPGNQTTTTYPLCTAAAARLKTCQVRPPLSCVVLPRLQRPPGREHRRNLVGREELILLKLEAGSVRSNVRIRRSWFWHCIHRV